jgi:sulfonate transport system permease protein
VSISPPPVADTWPDVEGGTVAALSDLSAPVEPARRTVRRSRRRVAIPRGLRRLTGPFALLGLWWLATAVGWIGPNTLPPPSDVIDIGWRMIQNGQLQAALWASSQRVVWGLGIGVSAGLAIAVFAGLSRLGEDLFDSTMQVLKAIPNVSLTPLLIIWIGIDEGMKIALIALSTSMPIYMNTYGAIRGVDARLIDTARTLGLGRVGLVRHIILPGAVPGFLVGLRLSMTSAWIALIFAEQINAQQGLGKLMSEARNWFRLDLMVLIILTYAVVGLLSYSFVRFLERRLLVWRRGFQGE